MSEAEITALLSRHGLQIMFLLAVIEGPIVTIIAAALAFRGYFDPWAVGVVALAGDIVGDVLLYGIGRLFPALARRLAERRSPREGGGPSRLDALFRTRGLHLLVFGKMTHVLGFAVILGAGLARMPMVPFIVLSVIATVPKVLILILLGFLFDVSLSGADLGRMIALLVACGVVAIGFLELWRRRCA